MISRDFIMMMIGIIGFILTFAVTMLSCKVEELQKELSFIHEQQVKQHKINMANDERISELKRETDNYYSKLKLGLNGVYGKLAGGGNIVSK